LSLDRNVHGFERGYRLRSPFFDDFEVVGRQPPDRIAVLVRDNGIDLNRSHASPERSDRFLGRGLRHPGGMSDSQDRRARDRSKEYWPESVHEDCPVYPLNHPLGREVSSLADAKGYRSDDGVTTCARRRFNRQHVTAG